MQIPKRYGESRVDSCPFCGKRATALNSQSLPVCVEHKNSVLGSMKCACGNYLDIMKGKFGAFFLCMSCGAMSLSKVLAINKVTDVSEKKSSVQKPKPANDSGKKEIQVRSDDPNYF